MYHLHTLIHMSYVVQLHVYIYNGAAVYQWCGFKSRRGKNKNLTALKSNSNKNLTGRRTSMPVM
jgi:hypothetical protein